MRATQVGNIKDGQDGAIYRDFLFRFGTIGECTVYRLVEGGVEPFGSFVLDKAELLKPHSNSVAFGNEFYAKGDEFPLLYTNVYNNYAKTENKLKGVTCVYRLCRADNQFSTKLVQTIEIGFAEDLLWRSNGVEDIRPFGNFAIDRDNNHFYAFVMRDEEYTTRYFKFLMPTLAQGEWDADLEIRRVVLQSGDVLAYFDCPYHHYLQGATLHKGVIYSVEGFTNGVENPPALRQIDLQNQRQKAVYYFKEHNMPIEPEFIDFADDLCYYADGNGNLFTLTF